FLLLICWVLFLLSCEKSEFDGKIPSCIWDTFSQSFIDIKMQKINGEKHYWLHTGDIHIDGIEYIVNSQCDTVCIVCAECLPPDCLSEYDDKDWKVIWKR
ncbi:MAG: hypothetical protein AAFO82_24195, partial [Bacteroidota bacterium]